MSGTQQFNAGGLVSNQRAHTQHTEMAATLDQNTRIQEPREYHSEHAHGCTDAETRIADHHMPTFSCVRMFRNGRTADQIS